MTPSSKNRALLATFSATLFLSAALMFSFQPMIGKMLLPIVGGSPSGWMVALAFFQIVLLAGYFAAHLLSRLSPRRQTYAYLGLVCAGSLFLPVMLAKSAGFIGDVPGPLDVLFLLSITVAVPFFALSATSSTLQRLFAATGHPAAHNPYFLYVASNLGSFAGLFLYPFVIEPRLRLTTQSACWLFGYLALIVAILLCLLQAPRETDKREQKKKTVPLAWQQRLQWMALAFVPSSLMMSLTFYATSEIVSMPLLWVIPLGLYLLTFVAAFSSRQIVSLQWLSRSQPVAVVLTTGAVFVFTIGTINPLEVFALHAAAFSLIALMCHLLLASSRPADSDRHLTLFYLLIAAGGALGGILNAFVAPFVFNSAVEYPLLLIASLFLNPSLRLKRSDLIILVLPVVFLAAVTASPVLLPKIIKLIGSSYLAVIAVTLLAVTPRAAIIGCIFIAFAALQTTAQNSIYEGRNFYGVLKVHDLKMTVGDRKEKIRFLTNGTTTHGKQSLEPGKEMEETSYYTRKGPLGEVFSTLKPRTIAAVGLGTGTIACYATPDNDITFFEINPQVQMVAEKYFTFLSNCGTGKKPPVILGDARLSLRRMEGRKFDLIILDAFSSDAIPTHLMTKEALMLYFDRLADDGILLFHVSNRYFTLGFPLVAEAGVLGVPNRVVTYDPAEDPYADLSTWVALSRSEDVLGKLTRLPWHEYSPEGLTPWTDDYDDLLSILRL